MESVTSEHSRRGKRTWGPEETILGLYIPMQHATRMTVLQSQANLRCPPGSGESNPDQNDVERAKLARNVRQTQKVVTVSQKHEVAWGKRNGFRGVKKYVHRRSQKYEENGKKTVNWRWLNVGIACSMTWRRHWKPLSQVASVLGSLRTFLPPRFDFFRKLRC